MTSSPVRPGSRTARRDLLCRTALCGALMGFVAVASPSFAVPAWTGQSQVNPGGTLPTISTGPATSVVLNAPRTVIDWSTYAVAAGESVNYSFSARNWIVLNRIQDNMAPTIAGTITGKVNGAFGGNIWFASHSGMIFGAGATVDAGGILISTAAPDIGTFLDPNNLTFSFPGTEVVDQPAIGMETGSSITGHGGLVAIIAPVIVTGAGTSVTGQNGSNVLYGAAYGFTLHLAQNSPGDFDLVDFIIPSAALGSDAQVLMDLQNTTTANSVFVAAVSRSTASSSVINLEGMITAQAVTTDGGDIILSGGGGIVGKQPGPTVDGGANTDFYLRTSSASRDIVMQNTGQVFGQPFVRTPPPPPITPPVISPPPPERHGGQRLTIITTIITTTAAATATTPRRQRRRLRRQPGLRPVARRHADDLGRPCRASSTIARFRCSPPGVTSRWWPARPSTWARPTRAATSALTATPCRPTA